MRLMPNQDIMSQITKLLSVSYKHNKLTALSIVSAVGSVNYCWLRMANQSSLTKIKGPLEIVSLSGTFDLNLSPHVHISIAKSTG
jgi:predicted DNA-binding protein with PD1-like motif